MFMQANENVLHWLRGSAGPRAATIEALEAESLNLWRTRVHSIPRVLNDAQVAHAVSETKRGYHHTPDAIKFREDLMSEQPGKDRLSFSDEKIGVDIVRRALDRRHGCPDVVSVQREPVQLWCQRGQTALRQALADPAPR